MTVPASADAFFAAVRKRLEHGDRAYGDASFLLSRGQLLNELADEALDLAGWGFVLWERIRRLELAERAKEAVAP